mgnify:CR=1 FL=1
MKRRTLLQLGIGGAVILTVAGGATALLRPGLVDGKLSPGGRDVFRAVGRAVLDGSLPAVPEAAAAELDAQLTRLNDTIAGFPAHTRDEISTLLSLLASAPGRIALAGLATPWPDASVAQIQQALQDMRTSSLSLRMQAYHALRDLTNAAYYADPASWAQLGYPGPREL